MSASFRHRLAVWVWDAVNAAIAGAVTTGGSIGFGAAFGAHDFSPRQLGSMALAGAASGVFMYIRQRRLPSIDEEETSPK